MKTTVIVAAMRDKLHDLCQNLEPQQYKEVLEGGMTRTNTIEKVINLFPETTKKDWKQHKNGNGWVKTSAYVDKSAYIEGLVFGNARVSGNAQVSGDAWVSGNAQVYGNARVFGNARVSGNAWVSVER